MVDKLALNSRHYDFHHLVLCKVPERPDMTTLCCIHMESDRRRTAADTWSLEYKACVRTKTWRTPFSSLTFRCSKSEMTMGMCGAPRQLHGWRMHVSTAFDPLATLRGNAGKLLIMWKQLLLRVMCTSEKHWWTVNTSTCVQLDEWT